MKTEDSTGIKTIELSRYSGLREKLISLNDSTETIRNVIREYGALTDQVFQKIKSVQGIANKTNLLAINASIETIHASDLLASFEEIVARNLIVQAKIIAQILEYDPDFFYQDGAKLARDCGMEEFFVTDELGVVQFTNMPSWKNSNLKSSEILQILKNPELEIALPAVGSGLDNEQYKAVGIFRTDKPGIIQTGAHFVRPKGQLAIDGFGVVAQEAKRLADVSKEISSRITVLINNLGDMLNRLKEIYEETEACIKKTIEQAGNQTEPFDEALLRLLVQEMKNKLANLENRLLESRKYFKDILSPLTELINIARQTNLLGVRAAIEAAHSTNDKQDFDNLLNHHMTAEAKLMTYLLERRPDLTCEDMVSLAENVNIEEIWVADENATVELTNKPEAKGFVYQNEGQTAPFLRILANPNLIVSPPPELRALDNKVFKYVGVGRKDKAGFLQVGITSKLYGESTSEGFSVVAKQIKNLAEQSRETAMEIEAVVEEMDHKAQKAVEHMRIIHKNQAEADRELDKI